MKIGPDKDENRDDKKLPSPDNDIAKIVIPAFDIATQKCLSKSIMMKN